MSKYSRSESCPIPRRNPVAMLPKSPLNRLAYQKQLSLQPSVKRNSFDEREQGLIQRLCASFGFIECCDRDVRLFFHFSQFSGDATQLQVGDGVEFHETLDKKDKRPVAVRVEYVPRESLELELVGDTRVTGTVDCVPKPVHTRGSSEHPLSVLNPPRWSQNMGRITCQQKGECFFLSFLKDDVEDERDGLHQGDEVSFFVSTHKRTGAVRAVKIILVQHCEEKKAQGIVLSLKDSFGFIERADEISEIFFHHSEVEGGIETLAFGSHVEFVVQDRHGKPVATKVVQLHPGTVKLEEVSDVTSLGYIQEVYGLPRSEREARDHVCGTVQGEGAGWDASFDFYKRDLITTCSLYEQDKVEFKIATDKRSGFERATEVRLIGLVDEDNGNTREVGMVTNLKEGFGFIKCADRDARVFFHFSEAIEADWQFEHGDEVEFSVLMDESSGKESAIRVKVLPRGSVQFEIVSDQKLTGTVTRELTSWVSSPTRMSPGERSRHDSSQMQGEIEFENEEGKLEIIAFQDSDLASVRVAIRVGDKVEFNICQSKRTGVKHAVAVTLLSQREEIWHKGYIAFLKEHFGFIEFMKHNGEIFFHFGSCVNDTADLTLGCAVKYTVSYKSGRSYAEQLTCIPREEMQLESPEGDVLDGVIVRQLRDTESKAPYEGVIEYEAADAKTVDDESQEKGSKVAIPFGVTGLVEPKTYLQVGDKVRFQLGYCQLTRRNRAVSITHDRERYRGVIDVFYSERNFGFIASSAFDNDNLFFHASEVQNGKSVKVGDQVEFSISFSQKARKNCAVDVKVTGHVLLSPRKTERIRNKESSDANAKVSVLRQPLGPDGMKGFNLKRTPIGL